MKMYQLLANNGNKCLGQINIYIFIYTIQNEEVSHDTQLWQIKVVEKPIIWHMQVLDPAKLVCVHRTEQSVTQTL